MNKNPWIRVEDRLPEPYDAVLVCIDFCGALESSCGFRWNGTEWEVEMEAAYDYWQRYEGTVTHWMPMPEPPKEGEA